MLLKVISESKGWAAGEEFRGFEVRQCWVLILPPLLCVTLAPYWPPTGLTLLLKFKPL